jgi:hypothetical protein
MISHQGGGRSDYEKFLLDSIFPTKLTEFPTKFTEFVPFIFIISQYFPTVKRILRDWLCLPMHIQDVLVCIMICCSVCCLNKFSHVGMFARITFFFHNINMAFSH